MATRAAIDLFMGAFALVFLLHQLTPPVPSQPPPRVQIQLSVEGVPSSLPCRFGFELVDAFGETKRNFAAEDLRLPTFHVDPNENTCSVSWSEEFEVFDWSDIEVRVVPFVLYESSLLEGLWATLRLPDGSATRFAVQPVPICVLEGRATVCAGGASPAGG